MSRWRDDYNEHRSLRIVRAIDDASRRRALIPSPAGSEEQAVRFAHRDLRRLEDDMLWAEHVLISYELASRIFHRRRSMGIPGAMMSEVEWLRERLGAVDAETARRQCEQQRRRA